MQNKNNNSIKMGYINPKCRKPKRKLNLKLIGKGVAAIGASVIIIIEGSTIINGLKDLIRPKQITVPNDKISYSFCIELEEGDTVSEIASKYYTDDTADTYGSFSNYTKHIEHDNRTNIDNVEAGDKLQIPVIVDKDNPYYIEILNIKKQIEDLEQNHLWVMYTIKYGDSISELAQLVSSNPNEIRDYTNKIYNKNHLGRTSVIVEGQKIWIINPELGNLKHQLNDIEEQLRQSLIKEQVKK